MGQLDQFVKGAVEVLLHAQLSQGEVHAALVQQPHHDPFAVDHGNDRDANVDLAAGHSQFDPAVLRQTTLGNV